MNPAAFGYNRISQSGGRSAQLPQGRQPHILPRTPSTAMSSGVGEERHPGLDQGQSELRRSETIAKLTLGPKSARLTSTRGPEKAQNRPPLDSDFRNSA